VFLVSVWGVLELSLWGDKLPKASPWRRNRVDSWLAACLWWLNLWHSGWCRFP